MNRIIKVGIAALAMAAVVPSFAQDVEIEEEEGPIGWPPVCIGLATPVQLPWGLDRWDVFGLDLNVFYAAAPKMYGLDIGGLATLGLNFGCQSVYGMDAGLIAFRDKFYGFDAEFLGSAQREMCGLQIGGLANVSAVESYGVSIAGITNLAKTSYGLQLSAIFNMTDELHGAQIALVNYADECVSGFQIGLVNIIMSNKIKVLPIVNGYF